MPWASACARALTWPRVEYWKIDVRYWHALVPSPGNTAMTSLKMSLDLRRRWRSSEPLRNVFPDFQLQTDGGLRAGLQEGRSEERTPSNLFSTRMTPRNLRRKLATGASFPSVPLLRDTVSRAQSSHNAESWTVRAETKYRTSIHSVQLTFGAFSQTLWRKTFEMACSCGQ